MTRKTHPGLVIDRRPCANPRCPRGERAGVPKIIEVRSKHPDQLYCCASCASMMIPAEARRRGGLRQAATRERTSEKHILTVLMMHGIPSAPKDLALVQAYRLGRRRGYGAGWKRARYVRAGERGF